MDLDLDGLIKEILFLYKQEWFAIESELCMLVCLGALRPLCIRL